MKKLTDEEIDKAYKMWLAKYSGSEGEMDLVPFMNSQIRSVVPNRTGWLRKSRNSLFLSAETLATRLKVSRAAYSKYEECEEKGSISLAKLAKAAEAMDCELVYAIRPKSRKYFSQIIFEKLLSKSLLNPWLEKCDQKRRSAALVFLLKKYMNDSEFRKEQGWSQRANS